MGVVNLSAMLVAWLAGGGPSGTGTATGAAVGLSGTATVAAVGPSATATRASAGLSGTATVVQAGPPETATGVQAGPPETATGVQAGPPGTATGVQAGPPGTATGAGPGPRLPSPAPENPPPVRLMPVPRPGPPLPVEPLAPAPAAKASPEPPPADRRSGRPPRSRRSRRDAGVEAGAPARREPVRPRSRPTPPQEVSTSKAEAERFPGSPAASDAPAAVPEGRSAPSGGRAPPPSGGTPLIPILLPAILATWLVMRLARAVRRRALAESPIATALSRFERVAYAVLVGLVAWFGWWWVSPSRDVALWGGLVLGVFVLWSTRNLLPDVAAGLVLRAEGTLTRGSVLELRDEGAGVVEHLGYRSLALRDDRGRAWWVPYRALAQAPFMRSERHGSRHRFHVRVPASGEGDVRRVVEQAVAIAPYVRVGEPVHVERNPLQTDEWTVEVGLVDRKYFSALQGELAERIDRVLRGRFETT